MKSQPFCAYWATVFKASQPGDDDGASTIFYRLTNTREEEKNKLIDWVNMVGPMLAIKQNSKSVIGEEAYLCNSPQGKMCIYTIKNLIISICVTTTFPSSFKFNLDEMKPAGRHAGGADSKGIVRAVYNNYISDRHLTNVIEYFAALIHYCMHDIIVAYNAEETTEISFERKQRPEYNKTRTFPDRVLQECFIYYAPYLSHCIEPYLANTYHPEEMNTNLFPQTNNGVLAIATSEMFNSLEELYNSHLADTDCASLVGQFLIEDPTLVLSTMSPSLFRFLQFGQFCNLLEKNTGTHVFGNAAEHLRFILDTVRNIEGTAICLKDKKQAPDRKISVFEDPSYAIYDELVLGSLPLSEFVSEDDTNYTSYRPGEYYKCYIEVLKVSNLTYVAIFLVNSYPETHDILTRIRETQTKFIEASVAEYACPSKLLDNPMMNVNFIKQVKEADSPQTQREPAQRVQTTTKTIRGIATPQSVTLQSEYNDYKDCTSCQVIDCGNFLHTSRGVVPQSQDIRRTPGINRLIGLISDKLSFAEILIYLKRYYDHPSQKYEIKRQVVPDLPFLAMDKQEESQKSSRQSAIKNDDIRALDLALSGHDSEFGTEEMILISDRGHHILIEYADEDAHPHTGEYKAITSHRPVNILSHCSTALPLTECIFEDILQCSKKARDVFIN